MEAAAQPGNIRIAGVVRDENGRPMPGASVAIDGTSQGTIADEDGRFTLNVGAKDKTIRVSFVGYADRVVSLGGRTEFAIDMKPAAVQVEEVASAPLSPL